MRGMRRECDDMETPTSSRRALGETRLVVVVEEETGVGGGEGALHPQCQSSLWEIHHTTSHHKHHISRRQYLFRLSARR